MAQVEDARLGSQLAPDQLDQFVGCGAGERQRNLPVAEAVMLGVEAPRLLAGAVLLVAAHHLVAGAEHAGQRQRARHHVDPEGGVGDQHQIVRVGPDEAGESRSGVGQVSVELAPHEAHRLALEPELPRLVGLEHRPGGGAVGAVVEEVDVGFEQEQFSQMCHRIWGA